MKILPVILTCALFTVMFTVNAHATQASDYGALYAIQSGESQNLNTEYAATDARSWQSNKGYSATAYTREYTNGNNPVYPSDVVNRMKSDNVFYFAGHGVGGEIYFIDAGSDGKNYISALNNGAESISSVSSLSQMKLAVFMACNSGNSDIYLGNLPYETQTKGVSCSIGWTSTIYEPQVDDFSHAFWVYLASGQTVNYAWNYGLSSTYQYTGSYGGLQNIKIYGNDGVTI